MADAINNQPIERQSAHAPGDAGAVAGSGSNLNLIELSKRNHEPRMAQIQYNPEPKYPVETKDSGSFRPIVQSVEKVGQTALGLKAASAGAPIWEPKEFHFTPPSFKDAPLVSPETLGDFQNKRLEAFNFLNRQTTNATFEARGMHTDPILRTPSEEAIIEKLTTLRQIRGETKFSGVIPEMKVDISRLDPSIKEQQGYENLEKFSTAQDKLIEERGNNVRDLGAKERALYESNISAAKWGRAASVGALLGSEAVNIAVDQIDPRKESAISVVADTVSPLVMAARLTPMGKWAPAAQAAVIVGTHLATHFLLDKPVDKPE